MDVPQASDESKVLVIYTGGTIGMLLGHEGYVPEPYFLTETLRSQTRFHDPLQDSLFSNASSVSGFRKWNSSPEQSGRTSPQGDRGPSPKAEQGLAPTLRVRSSRPVGVLESLLSTSETGPSIGPVCYKIEDNAYEANLPSLVTPRPAGHGAMNKRIRYAILEWNPLLDSSNLEIDDWIRIATEIELNYHAFDAFVVLHGTDTMAYTSSALSFLLEDLGKSVIFTGAQIPLSQLRNDAVDNLLGALVIAGHYIIPECCLYFNHTLYRGNRVSKTSSYDLNAFNSPNFPPLVNVGIDIVINWNDVIRQTNLRRFRAFKKMNAHVATLRLFPGITAASVQAFLAPTVRGVVLETFGAGNAPQRADLMSTLKEACDRGVIIVAISQCAKGSVSAAYETGRALLNVGVVSGGDMTPECALAKLSYLLSKPSLSPAEIRELMGTPLRGELTRPASTATTQSDTEQNLEGVQGVLSQVVRLSNKATTNTARPHIALSPPTPAMERNLEEIAPWSWTAAEASDTHMALVPFLMHLAVAHDDLDGLVFCIDPESNPSSGNYFALHGGGLHNKSTLQARAIAGGVVNSLDTASGRAPLHTAALHGSIKCLNALLVAGASVHLRDALGHTALYYAARQGHADIVNLLVEAGGNLGGADHEGGYALAAYEKAKAMGDELKMAIWRAAGLMAK